MLSDERTERERLCRTCQEPKPEPDFYRYRDGTFYIDCKVCKNRRREEYRRTPRGLAFDREVKRRKYDPDRERERRRKYRRKNAEQEAQARAKRRARDPEKFRARQLLRRAVRTGDILKPDRCEDCGERGRRIDGHHDDYSKPFDVKWLCTFCHGRRHRIGASK